MALPKLNTPTFTLTIPSTGGKLVFRPFLVQEEKILLIAQESSDQEAIVRAVKQILNNCIIDGDITSVDTLATFDIEYYFLQLRARSVNNVIKLKVSDPDNKESSYDIQLDLNDIEVTKPEAHTNYIPLTDDISIEMCYPTYDILLKYPSLLTGSNESVFDIICECISVIYEGDNAHDFKAETAEEQMEFLNSLSVEHFNKLREFFDTMPALQHTIEVKRSDDTTFDVTLKGLNDFFTLG